MNTEKELQQIICWRTINDPPEKSGYVLLAIMHHNIPMVLMGHCLVKKESFPSFTQETYTSGVHITHWAYPPKHPYSREEI